MSAFEPIDITCFKAYDVRGHLPDQLNVDIAYRIGRAYAEFLTPSEVIVGRDIRKTSESLKEALVRGLTDGGTNVLDIGLCGTEEVYFATFDRETDGGIMVTASHNPIDYNGLKFVREGSRPISGDNGLEDPGQDALLLTAAAPFLSFAYQDDLVELVVQSKFVQGRGAAHDGFQLGQPSLVKFREGITQEIGQDESQNGIAQEFQDFVIIGPVFG